MDQRPTRILLVEDDPSLLALLHEALTDEGFTVARAQDGWEALEHAHASSPDLILTDLMMPAMDGHALARRLRQQPTTADTPILLITAAFPLPDTDVFTIVLPKPFDLERLLGAIHEILR